MNSRHMQYVILLSQYRNFSQAAEALGMSQPALSKQIISLETELGVKLFDRNHVPMTLTPAGEYFVRKARSMLYEEEQLLKAIEQFKTGENGKLEIGTTPFRSMYLMPDIVKKIKLRYPGIQVVIHEANTALLRKNAAEGKYDFAVVNLPVDDAVFDITPLEPDTLVLAVPNEMMALLPHEKTKDISFADCAGLPFVVLGEHQEMRQLYDRLCTLAGIQPNIAAEVVGITTAWAMAKAGVGAVLLPYQFVRSGYFSEDLTLIPITNDLHTRQPAIITKRGQYVSEYAEFAMSLFFGSRDG